MRAVLTALAAVAALSLGAGSAAGGDRDDTAWLQARLDASGGTIFLPKLPNGECYATHGLWVSHDDTTVTSDGACITSLGPGEVRLESNDGDPIAADAVFYVNRSSKFAPAPDNVTISGLRIVVPATSLTYGISIYGHNVTVRDVTVTGSPIDDLYVGDRMNGDGYSGRVLISHCWLEGGGRNVLSAVSFVGLTIEHNTIIGASNAYVEKVGGNPAAGIDIEPNSRGNLALDLRIVDNVIADNAGPGILLALRSNTGNAINADRFTISHNTIIRNGAKDGTVHGGIVVFGGQADGKGRATVIGNAIRNNRGPGVLGWQMTMTFATRGNSISGNEGAAYQNVRRVQLR